MNSILKLIFILAFGLLLYGCGYKDSPSDSVGAKQRKATEDEEFDAEWYWETDRAEFDWRLAHDSHLIDEDDGTVVKFGVEDIDGEKAYELSEILLATYGHTEYVKKNYLKIIARQSEYERIFITQKEIERGGIKERIAVWRESQQKRLVANQDARAKYCNEVFGVFDRNQFQITKLIGKELAEYLYDDCDEYLEREREKKDARLTEEREQLAAQKRELEADRAKEWDKLHRPWELEETAIGKMRLLGMEPRFVDAVRIEPDYIKNWGTDKKGRIRKRYLNETQLDELRLRLKSPLVDDWFNLEYAWSIYETRMIDNGVSERQRAEALINVYNKQFFVLGLGEILKTVNQCIEPRRQAELGYVAVPTSPPLSDEQRQQTIEILEKLREGTDYWSAQAKLSVDKPVNTPPSPSPEGTAGTSEQKENTPIAEPQEPENSATSSQDTPSLTETEISDLLKKESLTLGEITDLLEVVRDEETRAVILEEKVKSLTLSEVEILQRDRCIRRTESRTIDLHIKRLKKEQIELAKKKLESAIKRQFEFKTKDGKFSVVGVYVASNSKQVRLNRADNGEEVVVDRSLLADKTNDLIEFAERIKRGLESGDFEKEAADILEFAESIIKQQNHLMQR